MAGDKWPTPRASEGGFYYHDGIPNIKSSLSTLVKFWPTPTAGNNYRNTKCPPSELNGTHGLTLGSATQLWPTPTANDGHRAGKADNLEHFYKRQKEKAEQGINLHFPLNLAAKKWPIGEGSLNPAWVCAHLMNWPAGWDSLEPLPENSIKEWKEKTKAGTWWSEEPDIPRIGKNIPDRAKRLKVLGNGMVPLCFAVAFEELSR